MLPLSFLFSIFLLLILFLCYQRYCINKIKQITKEYLSDIRDINQTADMRISSLISALSVAYPYKYRIFLTSRQIISIVTKLARCTRT